MTGQTIAHYEVLGKLGEGGMGAVYKARDMQLDRLVALKVLLPGRVIGEDRRARFVQEARAASALNHPNIITIHEISSANGVDFITMEFIRGRTLEQAMGRKGLPSAEVLKYAVQIADALATAHAAGIVHRDLKPGNIMITEKGLVKVLDFGLAKLTEPAHPDESEETQTVKLAQALQTEEGMILGTVAYMSPEQAEGRKVDARSDIFSFGSVLYEMTTGRRVFQGDTKLATLSAILKEDPPPLPAGGTPRDLEKILFRCLRKDPDRRFQHMADVKVALEEVREESESAQTLAARVIPPRTSGRRWGYIAAAAAILALTAAGAWLWWRPRPRVVMTVLTRVTSDSGLTKDPALSADGKLIAYASDRGGEGNLDIWVQQISGGEAIRLTRDPADDYEPGFSPDGSKIAFRSEREGGGIYVVSALGGDSRLVAPSGHDPHFSPDGNWIAYWSGDYGSALRSSGYVVPATGGEPRQIQPEFDSVRFPMWSPDGAHLLFAGARKLSERAYDWWAVGAAGESPVSTGAFAALVRQGLPGPYNGWVPAAWTPDDHVLFTSALGDSTNLWRVTIAPRSLQVQGPAERVTTGSSQEDHPSAAAGLLAFVSLNETAKIWSLPLAANEGRVTGAPQRLTSGAATDLRPTISANGQTVVYVSNRSGNWDLWRKDLKTGGEAALTATPSTEFWPNVSPDGSRVAYATRQNVGPQAVAAPLLLLGIRGGVPEKVCDDCFRPAAWSPDGKKILYQRRYAGHEGETIGLLDLASRQKARILWRDGHDIASGTFSPDGQWVGFTERTSPLTRRLWIARLHGLEEIPPGEWMAVTGGATLDRELRWSPDGNLLYFISTRDGFNCLWAQRLDRTSRLPVGDPFAVHHLHQAQLGIRAVDTGWLGLSLAADRIVVSLSERTGNVWLMESRR